MQEKTYHLAGKLIGALTARSLPKAEFKEILAVEEKIPMRDGTKLSATVLRPDSPGSFPTIMLRNPYVANHALYSEALRVFVKRGYVCVMIWVRGTGTSEGEWKPFVHERADGQDCIDWIAEQTWCDGNIGCYGLSYLGFTQWSIADYEHPALKSLYIGVSGASAYHCFWRRGMFRQDIWTQWALQMMEDNRYRASIPASLCREACDMRPASRLGEHYKGVPCEWYKAWINAARLDDPCWQEDFWKELSKSAENAKVPMMLQAGWFDPFLRPEMESWRALPNKIRSRSRLLIGPWNHNGMNVGDLKHKSGSRGGLLFLEDAFHWFEYTLKGKAYPYSLGVVEAYNVRENRWHIDAEAFPYSSEQTWYLGENGQLLSKPSASGSQSFVYDPQNPVESVCGNALGAANAGLGPKLQPSVGAREDVVSFLSEPFSDDVDLSGQIRAKLFVTSDRPATAFTVCVSEVLPNGKTYNIRDDITDIRWRDEHSIEEYTPGEIACLELELADITWRLSKGSRLRVDISSSNHPLYHVHPNTAEPWGDVEEGVPAHQTIFVGGNTASSITIPIR